MSTYVPERDGDRLTGYCAVCRTHQRVHHDGRCPKPPGSIVWIARCPVHGIHGERTECFECGRPVQQVPMVVVGALAVDEVFDAEELLRWAETYGHPEEWAKRAQAAHTRGEEAEERAERAETERDEAIKALRFYADANVYEDEAGIGEAPSHAPALIDTDTGKRAREALARLRSNEKGAGDRG